MPLDPEVNARIDELVADVHTKRAVLSDAVDADDVAQDALATASSMAASKRAERDSADAMHDASIDALIAYLASLK